MDHYYCANADNLAKLTVPLRMTSAAVERTTNYRSLVDERCCDFIHWMRAVSA
jgi:hypothetical protein